MKKEYLIYGGLGVVVLIALYYATKDTPKGDTSEDEGQTVSDIEQGSDKTKEQIKLDPALANIFKSPTWNKDIIGKKVYSKIADIKLRDNELVNDGLINNIYGVVSKAGTYLGDVVGAYYDRGGAINPESKVKYKWVKIKLTDAVYKEVQSEKSFLTKDLFKIPNVYKYVREDVIKL
jgi:hypothetical protein